MSPHLYKERKGGPATSTAPLLMAAVGTVLCSVSRHSRFPGDCPSWGEVGVQKVAVVTSRSRQVWQSDAPESIVYPVKSATWKSPGSVLGAVGSGATVASALIFVLHRSLNQTLWVVLMASAVTGFCAIGIATWAHSRWWLVGLFFSLLLIVALLGAIAG
jgi:hypothetical protein